MDPFPGKPRFHRNRARLNITRMKIARFEIAGMEKSTETGPLPFIQALSAGNRGTKCFEKTGS
jgi:hypothetical protein